MAASSSSLSTVLQEILAQKQIFKPFMGSAFFQCSIVILEFTCNLIIVVILYYSKVRLQCGKWIRRNFWSRTGDCLQQRALAGIWKTYLKS
ncbi:hypothetical protein C0J52_23924 [Blattella germanica]|nr:hypothetical protein C0J52_23924 [Blattella germanica]